MKQVGSSTTMGGKASLLVGGLACDDRGYVGFVNEFDFSGIRRFYTVTNHRSGLVRAWHGHRNEAKYVTAVAGAALVAAVQIDDWNNPSPDLPLLKFVLSAQKPAILHIPAGFANGSMSLTSDAVLIFFSTATLEESIADDIRFNARHWDAWQVEER